jgi:hypothetical protein
VLTVTNGTTYYYVVSAAIGAGESANSGEVSATPQWPLRLVANPDAGALVTLSWPAWATNYTVRVATNLTPPIEWQLVTNSPQSSNGTTFLTLPTANAEQQFYLLKAP